MLTRLPLLIDAHFHARDFNQSHKGTFASETAAALAGGFGAIGCMPNTDPPLTTERRLFLARQRAEKNAFCDLWFNAGVTEESLNCLRRASRLARAVKIYLNHTTGNLWIKDLNKVADIFDIWPVYKPILIHAEEVEKIQFCIEQAQISGRHLHVCHVNRADQVAVIRRARQEGVRISAEVCPHHLVFTQNDLRYLGNYGLMKPPLSSKADQAALWQGLEDGSISIIATDHAPHTPREKVGKEPAFGVIGEPAFSVVWSEFAKRGWEISKLVQLMSTNPRRLFNLPEDRSSFMEVDLDEKFTFEKSMVRSKAKISPYIGRVVQGRIHRVELHGVEVVRHGEIVAQMGRLI